MRTHSFDLAGCRIAMASNDYHFVSTWPESRFVQTLTAQRVSREARHVLRNRALTIDRGIDIETRHLRSRDEVLQVLDEVFGLPLPADAPLRTPE